MNLGLSNLEDTIIVVLPGHPRRQEMLDSHMDKKITCRDGAKAINHSNKPINWVSDRFIGHLTINWMQVWDD